MIENLMSLLRLMGIIFLDAAMIYFILGQWLKIAIPKYASTMSSRMGMSFLLSILILASGKHYPDSLFNALLATLVICLGSSLSLGMYKAFAWGMVRWAGRK